MRVHVKHGLDVSICGKPEQVIHPTLDCARSAIVLDDYHDLHPSMVVKVGDRVSRGERLFTDRKHPLIAFTSFSAGTVVEIARNAQQRITHLVVERDGDSELSLPQHDFSHIKRLSGAKVRELLLESGAWTALRARPFNRVASPEIKPRAIFVTAIDTNPLAPNPAVVLAPHIDEFNVGLVAIAALTTGITYVCTPPNLLRDLPDIDRIQLAEFSGSHPAGLPSTHIHAIGLKIGMQADLWHINYQDVMAIGTQLLTGRIVPERVISLAGPAALHPRLVTAGVGMDIAGLSAEKSTESHRVISGSVLCAKKPAQYLGRYDHQLTMLPKLLEHATPKQTWARHVRRLLHGTLGEPTYSTATNSWTSGMLPVEAFERVWPYRTPPAALLRALLANDVDSASRLGCLGLVEEDLALCEYVCPAKLDYASALRKTLQQMENTL